MLALAVALLTTATVRADDPLEALGKVTSEWVRTRNATVTAQTEWEQQKELLRTMVATLQERAAAAEEKRDQIRAKTAADRRDLDEMAQQNEEARVRTQTIAAALQDVDRALAALRPRLPPRLSAALELPFRSLADPHLGPSERMQLTMAVLARCDQFNRTLTFSQEIVAAPGLPRAKLLDTAYWGLAIGYAYDRISGGAWLGRPEAAGWVWESCAAAAPALKALWAQHEDKAEPAFVALPAQIGP